MNDGAKPPSLYLFNRLDEYIASIRLGAVNERTALDDNTAIYLFCDNFFLQFFDYCFGDVIAGVTENAKERATRFRLSLHGTDKQAAAAAAVISQFEYYCDLRSDLRPGHYLATRNYFLPFHKEYIPELLGSIGTWATAEGLNELAQRSQQALNDYQTAVTRL